MHLLCEKRHLGEYIMLVEPKDSTRKVLREPQWSGYVLTDSCLSLFLFGDIKPEATL